MEGLFNDYMALLGVEVLLSSEAQRTQYHNVSLMGMPTVAAEPPKASTLPNFTSLGTKSWTHEPLETLSSNCDNKTSFPSPSNIRQAWLLPLLSAHPTPT